MALKIWSDFKAGDRVMTGDCQRDIGTIREVMAGCDVAGWAVVQWDSDGETSRIRADMLKPSPHVEDETWEYMLDLLLSGEVTPAEFRSQMDSVGYAVQQINNAIDYNWEEIRANMLPELA
jgi:hypothetical protein